MNKRSVSVAIAACILFLAGLAGYLVPAPAETPPPRLLMDNSQGHIVFTHKVHSTAGGAYGDNACSVCHHELNMDPASAGRDNPEVMACAACHSAPDDDTFKTAHQEFYQAKGGDASCVACHHTRLTGLSGKWNHTDHVDYAQEDCESCHHPLRYEHKPGKFMTIKPQKCSNCHTAKGNAMTVTTLKDAAHQKCESCHSDLFEARSEGCATCHAQAKTADDLAKGVLDKNFPSCQNCHGPMPGGMDAYHKSCMGCHDARQKGPGTKAPCAQCHIPRAG